MILGLVMYLLVEDTGNTHAQCLDIMLPPLSMVLHFIFIGCVVVDVF
jgi:hypothetical protein